MHGEVTVENSRMTLSETPANVSRRAPMFGEDTELILRSFLSYDDEKVKELQGKGVFK
jgi:crotonobetainyl-CoA:carnitine CoA-transferase CaiB-like acyl-CoA transferase